MVILSALLLSSIAILSTWHILFNHIERIKELEKDQEFMLNTISLMTKNLTKNNEMLTRIAEACKKAQERTEENQAKDEETKQKWN